MSLPFPSLRFGATCTTSAWLKNKCGSSPLVLCSSTRRRGCGRRFGRHSDAASTCLLCLRSASCLFFFCLCARACLVDCADHSSVMAACACSSSFQACKDARLRTEKLLAGSNQEEDDVSLLLTPSTSTTPPFPTQFYCEALHDAFFRISFDDVFPSTLLLLRWFVACCCLALSASLFCVQISRNSVVFFWLCVLCVCDFFFLFFRAAPFLFWFAVLVGTYSQTQLPPLASSAQALDFLKVPRPCCEPHLHKGCHEAEISRCVCAKVRATSKALRHARDHCIVLYCLELYCIVPVLYVFLQKSIVSWKRLLAILADDWAATS